MSTSTLLVQENSIISHKDQKRLWVRPFDLEATVDNKENGRR
jgi:hypothetical protein